MLKTEGNLDGKLVTATRSNGQELGDMPEVSHKLDNTLLVLKRMMKESGPTANAVKQFVDKFERLQGDQNQLEEALTSFGNHWDWLTSGVADAGVSICQAPTMATMTPVTTTALPQHPQVHSPSESKKAKKKIKLDEKEVAALTSTPTSMFSTNIVGGQIVLQPQAQAVTTSPPRVQAHTPVSSIMDSDNKKRRRARCGNCTGCLNRDKTQDCRQCRNCLDQKRYGGPGRLKKACVKRQCVVITQSHSLKITSFDIFLNLKFQTNNDAAPSEAKVNTVSAVKSEPTLFSVKTEAGSDVEVSLAPATSHNSAPTLLSWPSGASTPFFSVQVSREKAQTKQKKLLFILINLFISRSRSKCSSPSSHKVTPAARRLCRPCSLCSTPLQSRARLWRPR